MPTDPRRLRTAALISDRMARWYGLVLTWTNVDSHDLPRVRERARAWRERARRLASMAAAAREESYRAH